MLCRVLCPISNTMHAHMFHLYVRSTILHRLIAYLRLLPCWLGILHTIHHLLAIKVPSPTDLTYSCSFSHAHTRRALSLQYIRIQRNFLCLPSFPCIMTPLTSSFKFSSMAPRMLTPVFFYLALHQALPGTAHEAPSVAVFVSTVRALAGSGWPLGVGDDGVRYFLLIASLFRSGFWRGLEPQLWHWASSRPRAKGLRWRFGTGCSPAPLPLF